MPYTRDEWITDEMIRAVDHLSTGQLGKLFSWLMLTYAQRHGLNQDDVDAHKAAMLKARPDKMVAERLRIEKLLDIKQTEVDELTEDLTRLNKIAEAA